MIRFFMASLFALALMIPDASRAANQQDFDQAYASAQAANAQAAAIQNSWTETIKVLKAAKDAASAQDFGKAVTLAREAEALAKLSIEQAKAEDTAWRDAVVR